MEILLFWGIQNQGFLRQVPTLAEEKEGESQLPAHCPSGSADSKKGAASCSLRRSPARAIGLQAHD